MSETLGTTVVPSEPSPVSSVSAVSESAPPAFVQHTEIASALESPAVSPTPEKSDATIPVPTQDTRTEQPPDALKAVEAQKIEPETVLAPIEYPDFKLPDGVSTNQEVISSFKELLNQHRLSPEAGQSLIDLYGKQAETFAKEYQSKVEESQHRAFAEVRRQWVDQIKADPEIGGSGSEYAKAMALKARDAVVPEKDRVAFNEALRVTGAGDHPAIYRAFYRMGKLLDDVEKKYIREPSIQKVVGRPPEKKVTFNDFYDHPTSRVR